MDTLPRRVSRFAYASLELGLDDGTTTTARVKKLVVDDERVAAMVLLDSDPLRPFRLEGTFAEDRLTLLESRRGSSYGSFDEAIEAPDFEPIHDVVSVDLATPL